MADSFPALSLASLPLFPLGTVLFPGGVLRLRVFEVRYLDMVRKCHQSGAPFGVVALARGSEVRVAGAEPEQLHPAGTLARIEQVEQPQAGLLLLQCRGEQRFHVDHAERLKHGLWVANVTLLPDEARLPVPDHLQHAAQSLRQAHASLRARADTAPVAWDAADYDDCGWVANRWAELLPLAADTKQGLMRLDSPLLRLELVADVLAKTGIGADG